MDALKGISTGLGQISATIALRFLRICSKDLYQKDSGFSFMVDMYLETQLL
jgi:hypothetical protein